MEQKTPRDWIARYLAEVDDAMREEGVTRGARALVIDELEAQYYEELTARASDPAAQWAWLYARPSPSDFANAYHEHAPEALSTSSAGTARAVETSTLPGSVALATALLAAPLSILVGAFASSAGHDGGHLGFLLFVALEVVAITLGLLSWSTRRGKVATFLGVALPALATVLGALGS